MTLAQRMRSGDSARPINDNPAAHPWCIAPRTGQASGLVGSQACRVEYASRGNCWSPNAVRLGYERSEAYPAPQAAPLRGADPRLYLEGRRISLDCEPEEHVWGIWFDAHWGMVLHGLALISRCFALVVRWF